MTQIWAKDAIFYHIYPLGLCGAPEHNHYDEPVAYRLNALYPWLGHIQLMGMTAIYLGPVFQSSRHGYDTVDYYQVDRRLGDLQTLERLAETIHQRGLRLVLDGVFNHVGRDFWAFRDVLANGDNSDFCDWFAQLRFDGNSPLGDPFTYEGWQDHYDLVKLNLSNPAVRQHLFDAVAMWIERFDIDGLRLDAADCLDMDFLQALHHFTKQIRPDFWLMGEVVHGDYRDWVNPQKLDAVTNYECYKGLYSSLCDKNYYEIAYSLNRQFGPEGIYRHLWLYNFVDNHDVDRVASKLDIISLLYPLYLLMFTMPGIPSIYYGSEWGIQGGKEDGSDAPLRPALNIDHITQESPQPELVDFIRRLSEIRKASVALRKGNYQEAYLSHQQFAFIRQVEGETVIVLLNSAPDWSELSLTVPWDSGSWVDLLEGNKAYGISENTLKANVPPYGGRILYARDD